MKSKNLNRILSFILCFVMIFSSFGFMSFGENANTGIISVSTADDLIKLAKNCKLDTWSQGKTVVLVNDIDLTGADFTSIPTFGGVFDGNGHTISGYYYIGSSSHCGIFRYLQQGSTVKALAVTGVVEPTGTKSYVGGIVGTNNGNIYGCNFRGVVSGKNNIGGIVGTNETTGVITGCEAYGTFDGEHYVGGIAGQNSGSIVNCKNFGSVSTSAQDSKVSLQDLSIDLEKINSTENFVSQTDIGGITGFSTGLLQSCENHGNVGYQHAGYNVGGIVGRQSGYMNGCKNYGTINGRKDVGGIVGQMEPYLVLDFSKDTMQKLDDQFDILDGRIDKILNSADSYSDSVKSTLEGMKSTSGSLRTEAHNVADKTSGFVDGSMDTLNDVSARFVRAMEQTDDVIETGKSCTSKLTEATDSLKVAVSHMGNASENMTIALETLDPAIDELVSAGDYTTDALNTASDAVSDIQNSLGDTEKLKASIGKLADSIADAADSVGDAGDNIKNIASILEDMNSSEELESFKNSMIDGFKGLGDCLQAMSDAFDDVSDGVERMKKEVDTNTLSLAEGQLIQSIDSLSAAMVSSSMALSDIYNAVTKLKDATGDSSGNIKKFLGCIQEVINSLNDGAQKASDFVEYLQTVGTSPNEEQLAKIGEYVLDITSSYTDAGKYLSRATQYAQSVITSLQPDKADGSSDDFLSAISSLSRASNQFGSAFASLSLSIKNFKASIGSEAKFRAALEDVGEGLSDAGVALGDMGESISDMADAARKLQKSGYLDESFDKINEQLDIMGSVLKSTKTALETLSQAVSEINDQTDLSSLKDGFGKLADSLSTLSDATYSLKNAMAIVNDALPNVTTASDELTNALRETENSVGLASDSLDILTEVLDGVKAIVDEFNAKGDIVFPTLGSDYTDSVDNLFDIMSKLSDEAKSLSDTLKNAGDSLNTDLHSVSNTVSDVVDTIMDAYNDSLNGDDTDVFEDISDTILEDSRHGTVSSCTNYGSVNGDLNVGGNVGTMSIEYDFDPEDDVTNSGSNSLKFKYQTTAVLRQCINRGNVEAKKNCAGGNAGKMNLGTVVLCQSYGSVTSTSGDYVGGIAGSSESTLRQNYAMCLLSGGDYVGGIVGEGSKVINCFSLVEISEADEYMGAIAGNVKDSATCNYFVEGDVGGIDDISYAGIAEPRSYADFTAFDNIPDDFRLFQLIFVADEKIVDTIDFNYGDDLSEMPLPEIPQKDGYYGRWDDTDFESLRFGKTIEAVYTKFVTTLASGVKRGDKSVFLAEGDFGNDTKLVATKKDYSGKLPCDKGKVIEMWQVNLENDNDSDNHNHIIRFAAPEGHKNIRIFAIEDGKWKNLSYEKDGSYVVFEIHSNSTPLVIAKPRTNWLVPTLVLLLILAVIFVIFVVRTKKGKSLVAIHRKKRLMKKAQKRIDEVEKQAEKSKKTKT